MDQLDSLTIDTQSCQAAIEIARTFSKFSHHGFKEHQGAQWATFKAILNRTIEMTLFQVSKCGYQSIECFPAWLIMNVKPRIDFVNQIIMSQRSFSPKSFEFSDDESVPSLNSVIIERDEPIPAKVNDNVDLFYAQLSMSFYHKNYEKKTPRSATINQGFRYCSSTERQPQKGKTESLKTHRDFKPTPKQMPHNISRSTAESQQPTNSQFSNETLSKKAADIVNKAIPSVSIYQPSTKPSLKKPEVKKQVNAKLLQILKGQKHGKKDNSPSDSSASLLSANSFQANNINCSKLLRLLNSPYGLPPSTVQNAQQMYIQRQLNQIMKQQDNQKLDFNGYLRGLKRHK